MEKNNITTTGNYAFIGIAILGTGLGLALKSVAAGAVIGVGLGFLAKGYLDKKTD